MTIINKNVIDLPITMRGFTDGFSVALPFIISNGIAGMVMGVAYRGVGLDFFAAVTFSGVVYSGTAQAITLGLWTFPPPVAAMILASVSTNARYLVMGAHLRHLFADVPRRMMLPILFLLADASWLMTTAEAERGRRDAGYLLGSSLPMAIGWIGGTALGHVLPIEPHGPLAFAAAFMPLAFVASLLPSQWRGWRSVPPWGVSAAVAGGVAIFLSPSWAMLAGGGAGTLLAAVRGDDA